MVSGPERSGRRHQIRVGRVTPSAKTIREVRYGVPLASILAIESQVVPQLQVNNARTKIMKIVESAKSVIRPWQQVTPKDRMVILDDIWKMLLNRDGGYGFGIGNEKLLCDSMFVNRLSNVTSSLLYLVIANELKLPLTLTSTDHFLMVEWSDRETRFGFSMGYFYTDNKEISSQLAPAKDQIGPVNIHTKELSPEEALSIVYLSRGMTRLEMGDWKEASLDFDQAALVNPQDPILHTQIGSLRLHIKDFPAAETSLNKALTLEPDYSPAMFNLAILNFLMNREAAAQSCLRRALEINPLLQQVDINAIVKEIRSNPGEPWKGARA